MGLHTTVTSGFATTLLLVLAGCAAEPSAQPPAKAAAVPAVQAPLASTVTPTTQLAVDIKTARTLGYTPRQSKGKTVYCRNEAALGTRFPTTSCIPEDQLGAAMHRAVGNRDEIEIAQRHSLAQPNDKQ